MSSRDTTALPGHWWMKPIAPGLVQGELEVEFPIQRFGTGEQGLQDFGEQRDAKDHGIRAPCWLRGAVGLVPESARLWLNGLKARRGGKREKIPCTAGLGFQGSQRDLEGM